MTERWLPVVGYEELYEVSDRGRIRRNGRLLKIDDKNHCYSRVFLSKNGKVTTKYVHKLVAEAFLGTCPPGREVNHRKADRRRNWAANLEYTTHADNVRHSVEQGLIPLGSQKKLSKLTEAAVIEIRRMKGKRRHSDIAAEFGVSRPVITRVLGGKIWRHVNP